MITDLFSFLQITSLVWSLGYFLCLYWVILIQGLCTPHQLLFVFKENDLIVYEYEFYTEHVIFACAQHMTSHNQRLHESKESLWHGMYIYLINKINLGILRVYLLKFIRSTILNEKMYYTHTICNSNHPVLWTTHVCYSFLKFKLC